MSAGPIVNLCPNCGAPLELDEAAKCRWCHAPVQFAPSEADVGDDSQLMNTGLEELRQYRKSHFRLVPPEVCPSCGEVMEAFLDGRCDFCCSQSLARAK